MHPVARVASVVLALSAGAAAACSLGEGYLKPSNYELVKLAPAIVLAQAVAYDIRSDQIGVFTFKPLEMLKGEPVGHSFRIEGLVEEHKPRSSDRFDTLRSWTAFSACNVIDYRVGATYLLFLSRVPRPRATAMDTGMPPYSRVNEEVTSAQAPWLVAVRRYLEISRIGSYEQEKAALKVLQHQARAGNPGVPKPLALDVADHFARPSADKSYADLMALYRASRRDALGVLHGRGQLSRSEVLWALANAPHREARPLMRHLMRSAAWREHAPVLATFAVNARDAEVAAALLAKFPRERDEGLRVLIARAAGQAAGPDAAGLVQAALDHASADEAQLLTPWVARHGSPETIQGLALRIGKRYQEPDGSDAAYALADAGDPGVIAWAASRIGAADEDRWVGLYAIARSPLPQADLLARRVIREGSEDEVASLLQGYRESRSPHRWDRLADVARLPARAPKVERWLYKTLLEMAENGDFRAHALLDTLPPSTVLDD